MIFPHRRQELLPFQQLRGILVLARREHLSPPRNSKEEVTFIMWILLVSLHILEASTTPINLRRHHTLKLQGSERLRTNSCKYKDQSQAVGQK